MAMKILSNWKCFSMKKENTVYLDIKKTDQMLSIRKRIMVILGNILSRSIINFHVNNVYQFINIYNHYM